MNSPIQSLPIRDSKYVRHYKFLENYPWTYLLYQKIELCRWTLNRILLYQPLSCCASLDCNINYCEYHPWRCKCRCYKYYLNQYFYLTTIGEMFFWFLLLATIGVSIVLMLDDNENTGEAIGSISQILFLIAWFFGQRNTLWYLFFGFSFGMLDITIMMHNIMYFVALRNIL